MLGQDRSNDIDVEEFLALCDVLLVRFSVRRVSIAAERFCQISWVQVGVDLLRLTCARSDLYARSAQPIAHHPYFDWLCYFGIIANLIVVILQAGTSVPSQSEQVRAIYRPCVDAGHALHISHTCTSLEPHHRLPFTACTCAQADTALVVLEVIFVVWFGIEMSIKIGGSGLFVYLQAKDRSLVSAIIHGPLPRVRTYLTPLCTHNSPTHSTTSVCTTYRTDGTVSTRRSPSPRSSVSYSRGRSRHGE